MSFLHNVPSPCKDCNNRYVGCHGKCAGYAEFRNALNEVTEKYKTAKHLDEECYRHVTQSGAHRMYKKKRKVYR